MEQAVPPPPQPLEEGSFSCKLCGKNFPNKYRLHKHEKLHSETKLCRCTVPGCGKEYKRSTHLHRHLASHQAEKPHVCELPSCGKSFATKQKLLRHAMVHKGLMCEICGQKFRKKGLLERHQQAHASGALKPKEEEPLGSAPAKRKEPRAPKRPKAPKKLAKKPASTQHKCEHCEESFTLFQHLVLHRKQRHPKPFVCAECGKEYRQAFKLKEHQAKAHSEAIHLCTHEGCGQCFTSVSNLRVHLRVVHQGLRPFGCFYCGQTFGYKHVLRRHIEAAHLDEVLAKEETKEEEEESSAPPSKRWKALPEPAAEGGGLEELAPEDLQEAASVWEDLPAPLSTAPSRSVRMKILAARRLGREAIEVRPVADC